MTGTAVAVVSHVLNPAIRAMFERVRREAPADHVVRMVLSAEAGTDLAGLPEAEVERISREDILALGYPRKCRREGWVMEGNLDLVFLEFRRRHPGFGQYWFVEYDVHWEGAWRVLFERFRHSPADVIGTTVQRMSDVSHKDPRNRAVPLEFPPGMDWDEPNRVKGFYPLSRISAAALEALDAAYRAGLAGDYEYTLPSVAAQNGLRLEDFGGRGAYVQPDNVDRFYFASGTTYTHSPGTFVFRPVQRVLPRRNTMWHPVKPGGVPAWHPLRAGGGPIKNALEWLKPLAWQAAIRLWFLTRWRPLRDDAPASAPSGEG